MSKYQKKPTNCSLLVIQNLTKSGQKSCYKPNLSKIVAFKLSFSFQVFFFPVYFKRIKNNDFVLGNMGLM
ncbi:hypothetical protein XENTR_v10024762 [Xenopus tropicalis]|nr:hypothetical protein XENTR_v10024762 [Xenopus tropicalis]